MSNEDISIVLELDDREFNVKLKNAGKLVERFGNQATTSAGSLRKIERSVTGLTAKLRDFAVTVSMARGALHNIWAITGQWQQSILQATGDIERLTIMMEGMSTEVDVAARKLDALNNTKFLTDFAQNAPFRMQALRDTFVKLKSVGIDPTTGAMSQLTNAVAHFGGSDEILHRASIAIQQMRGKGVVSMEELRQQLGEAVPKAMNVMANSMHMSMGKFVDAVSKGTVESETALNKMLAEFGQQFGGANERMMQTWNGTMQALQSRWKLLMAEIGNEGGYFDTVKESMQELSEFLTTDHAKHWARKFGSAMGQAAQAIKQATKFTSQFYYEIRAVVTGLLMLGGARIAWNMIAGIGAAAMLAGTRLAMMGTQIMAGLTQVTQFGAALSMVSAGPLTAFSLALGAAGRAFMLLLGPIGAVAMAIWSLSTMFPDLSEKAAQAAQSIKDSMGDAVTARDTQIIKDRLQQIKGKLRGLSREEIQKLEISKGIMDDFKTHGTDVLNEIAILGGKITESTKKEMLAMITERNELMKQLGVGEQVLLEKTGDQLIRGVRKGMSEELEANRARYVEKMDMISKEMNATDGKMSSEEAQFRHVNALKTKLAADEVIFNSRIRASQEIVNLLRRQSADQLTEQQKNQLSFHQRNIAALKEERMEVRQTGQEAVKWAESQNKFITDEEKAANKVSKMQRTQLENLVNSLSIRFEQLQAQSKGAMGVSEQVEQKLRNIEAMANKLNNAQMSDEHLEAMARKYAMEIDQLKELIKNEKELKRIREAADRQAQTSIRRMEKFMSKEDQMGQSRSEKARIAHEERMRQMMERLDFENMSLAQRTQAQQVFEEYRIASEDRMARESRNALEIMSDEYAKATEKMDSVFSRAMDGMTDAFVEFAKTGKLSFSNMIESMLADMLKLQVQKSITGPLSGFLGTALSSFLPGTGGTVSNAGSAASAAGYSTTGYAGAYGFETGGIMTPYGRAELRAYEKGGIASSPQIALYGEGSMNEAFVPLPDGKTIPVTMRGGMSPNVEVNVINNSGQQVDAEQSEPRFDGQRMILDVVLEAANRPGTFRQGLKGALA